MQGKFITFEGIEGCGKSTQARALLEWLQAHGVPAILTREPGGTELGAGIREALLHAPVSVSPVAELLLFQADRNQHVVQKIRPALADGKWVISDRYYHSTLAYQAGGREIPLAKVRELIDVAIEGLEPDVVFFVDVPVEVGVARKRQSGDRFDRIESEKREFHERIREAYLALAKDDPRIVTVDGDRDKDVIHEGIVERIKTLMSR